MTMRIIYSFNKLGYEAAYWQAEIARGSSDAFTLIPFNHQGYLDPGRYLRAQLLDNLYHDRAAGLMRLYDDVTARIRAERADVLLVDNCNPYHPDFLRRLPIRKVLRIADGPISAYDRDFAYVHAFDLILYHTRAYSPDMELAEKLDYVGAKAHAFWPLGAFDAMASLHLTEEQLIAGERDIDIIFIGAMHVGKMPFIARLKRRYGRRMVLRGLCGLKKNLYFNLRYGFPGVVRPVAGEDFPRLYRRARIGINLHNRGEYTFGNYRLFDLACNGVAQVTDGGRRAAEFFEPGREILAADDEDAIIRHVDTLLEDDGLRLEMARRALARARRDHLMHHRFLDLARLLPGNVPTR